jgi:hypothetical protein
MILYIGFWIEVALIFAVLWLYVRHSLNDEVDRRVAEAERRMGDRLRRETLQ